MQEYDVLQCNQCHKVDSKCHGISLSQSSRIFLVPAYTLHNKTTINTCTLVRTF